MRVLRVYHSGRTPAHRSRERALVAAGVDVHLVVPAIWHEGGADEVLPEEPFPITELPVTRPDDVNRHRHAVDQDVLRRLVDDVRPDVLDLHEEPVSCVGRQWLSAAPTRLPVVMYTAQNIDKRFPPPFSSYESAAYRRVAALYPCSRQAASVARGKGFAGRIDVIPLGFDETLFASGVQSLSDTEMVLVLTGRLVPEKGVVDAVRVLRGLARTRPARLVVLGDGPERGHAEALASDLGIRSRVEFRAWADAPVIAEIYRRAHVTLVPSVPTTTWTEQFGRVIIEAHASGSVVAGYASGSIPEVAAGGAVLVEPGRPDLLAEEIARVLSDPSRFASLREQGLRLAATRTWTQVANEQAALYAEVAAGRTARRPLLTSSQQRRAAARREFGEPAPTIAGARPFALPLLRAGGPLPLLVAWLIDRAVDVVARGRAVRRRIGGRVHMP